MCSVVHGHVAPAQGRVLYPPARVVGRILDKTGILGLVSDAVGVVGRILDMGEIFGRHFAVLSTLSVRMSPEKACNV